MRRQIFVAVVFAAALVAIVVVKAPHDGASAAPNAPAAPGTPGPAATYTAQCAHDPTTRRCLVLRGAVTREAIDALETLRDAHDSRGVDVALSALSLDQPAIELVALQILGSAASRADVIAAVAPLLFGPHPALQAAAADILVNGDDRELAAIAQQWKQGHPRVDDLTSPYDNDDDQPRPAAVAKFTVYPNATRYSPADSASSIGFRTTDATDKVVAFYANGAKAGPLDALAWAKGPGAGPKPVSSHDADALELQRLVQRFAKTQDPKLMPQIQAAQQRLQARVLGAVAGPTSVHDAPAPKGDAVATYRVFVVEGTAAQPVRAVAIYREQAAHSTIVQLMWDTKMYP